MSRGKTKKRTQKLIAPGLQLRMVGAFLAMSALSLLLQFLLFARNLSITASQLPNDGPAMMSLMNELLAKTLMLSFAIGLPIIAAVGVLQTFKVAGPIHRFRMFLGQVARGERPADCQIRKGDELQEFCELLNEATAPLRRNEQETPIARTAERNAA